MANQNGQVYGGIRTQKGYYITAYAIAVKHGFSGTEEEWLASLKGEEGTPTEMRYNEELEQLEWKLKTSEEWTGVLPLAVIRGEAFDEAVQTVKETKESAVTEIGQLKESAKTEIETAKTETVQAVTELKGALTEEIVQAKTEAVNKAVEAKEAAIQAVTESKEQAEQLIAGKASEVTEKANEVLEKAQEVNTAKTKVQEMMSETEIFKGLAEDYANRSRLSEVATEQNKEIVNEKANAAEGSATRALNAKNAAEGLANEAQLMRNQAEGHANKAREYAQQAQNAAGGGVTSFNGRAGAIEPRADDYNAFYLPKNGKANDSAKLNGKSESHFATAQSVESVSQLAGEAKEKADQAFQSASNGKKAIAAAVTGKGVAASESDTFQVLAGKIGQIAQGSGNAMPRDVLLGKTFSNSDGSAVGAMPDNGGWTGEINVFGQVAIPRGYHDGSGLVTVRTRSGRTIRPGKQQQTAIQEMEMATSDIVVEGDSSLVPENIKEGVNIFGVQGALKSNNVKCSLIPPLDFVESKIALPDTDYPDRKIHPRLQFQEANGIQLMVFLAYTYNLENDEKVFPIRYGTNGALNKKSAITARPIYNFSNPAANWFAILTIDEKVDNFCIEFDTEYYDLEGYAYIVRW